MMTTSRFSLLRSMTMSAATIALGLAGCSGEERAEARTPPVETAPVEKPAEPKADPNQAAPRLPLVEVCDVPANRVSFGFDSAQLSAEARALLDRIAGCLATGAAEDDEVMIVGRTDAQGSSAYNERLANRRAEAVARYLGKKGVASDRIETAALGEARTTTSSLAPSPGRAVTLLLMP
jgi:OOP family OmpA-OmpF porin